VSGRRRLFRKLFTLAALGITGALLSQQETDLLPKVQATNYMVVDNANQGSYRTSLESTVPLDAAFMVIADGNQSSAVVGNSEGNGVGSIGVQGSSTGSQGIGVQGSALGGIGVLGLGEDDNCIPLVARGHSPTQSAHLQEWQNSAGTALSVVDPKGRLGVGTTIPTRMVHIIGNTVNPGTGLAENLRLESSTTSEVGLGLNNTNTGGHLWQIESTGGSATEGQGKLGFYDETAGAWRMMLDGSGNVGIGTTSPNYLLQVGANGAYCNGSTWNPASSIRWKENVTPLTEGVETLKQLHPVSFNYKKTAAKRTMGFIAEEVGKVLPTVVDWDAAEPGYAEGYDQTAILALAVQALKELSEKLETENATLRERIEALEYKLAAN